MEVLELQEQVMAWEGQAAGEQRDVFGQALEQTLERWRVRGVAMQRELESLFPRWDAAVADDNHEQQQQLCDDFKERLRDMAYVTGTVRNLSTRLSENRGSPS